MSFKLTPITAKIQKGTKGGIVQPILNMGNGPLTKRKSPVEQRGRKRVTAPKVSKDPKSIIAERNRETAENKIRQAHIDKYKNNPNATASDKKSLEGVRKKIESTGVYKYNKANEAARKAGEAGWAADDKARKSKLTKSTKITGKIGSDLRRKQYDAKGWAYDDTIKKPKTGVSTKLKSKGIKDLSTKTEVVKPRKQEPAKKAVKNATKKLDSADRKDSRASKVRQKGIDALASGDTKKALRLKRRETRIKNRADKKREQASKAINPN